MALTLFQLLTSRGDFVKTARAAARQAQAMEEIAGNVDKSMQRIDEIEAKIDEALEMLKELLPAKTKSTRSRK